MSRLKFSIGQRFKNNSNQEYVIIGTNGYSKHGATLYQIEFVDTKTVIDVVSTQIKNGYIKDYYAKDVLGVACLGNTTKTNNLVEYSYWSRMLKRCYDVNSDDYKNYGGAGVTICDEWLCFENFLRDFKELEGYDKDKIGQGLLALDKDKKQKGVVNKVYSKESCCLISMVENTKLRDTSKYRKKFIAITPEGEELFVCGIVDFCKKYRLSNERVKAIIDKDLNYKGWRFKSIEGV